MTAIQLSLLPQQTSDGAPYQHLKIQLMSADGIITPEDLQGLQLPETIDWQQGIVIEGRALIWLYGYLVHLCHPALWVACYDSQLGAVEVASHSHEIRLGQILPFLRKN
jgi:CRISPR-associated protein Csx3